MIELTDDKLRFSFPEVAQHLRGLTNDYIRQTLPRILEEDRDAGLDELLRSNYAFRRPSARDRENLRRLVQELPPGRIEHAFQREVRSLAGLDSEWNKPGELEIDFQRTLRIPDDGRDYFLPPGLGRFPLRHVDDYANRVPPPWMDRGGVLMPMYQAEALWLHFTTSYPFAVKVASGKINAVTGEPWRTGLNRRPQDYLVLPEQPWLDGFAVQKGIIRQFVAMPLGAGYSVEEQLSGKAEFGGIQIQIYPMKAEVYFQEEILPGLPRRLVELLPGLLPQPEYGREDLSCINCALPNLSEGASMGLGAGGRMKQEIYEDPHGIDVWDLSETSRCFVHLCNALVWREITGTNPPHPPVTAKEYERHGLPWFDFYRDDVAALEGSKTLPGVKSVAQLGKEKTGQPLPENSSISPNIIVQYGKIGRPEEIREFSDVP
jgi:hypothetical protein